jgi:PAS domain S-box-containing protein
MKVRTRLGDLSELDQAYAGLRESDDRFRELAEHIRDVFWLSDVRTGCFLYANPAYNELTLRCREELYDDPDQWFRSIHPDDRMKVEGAWGTVGDDFQGWNFEYRIIRVDGTERWVQERAFPVREIEGRAYRIAGITEDVTDKHEQRRRLRDVTHQLDLAFEEQRREIIDALHDDVSQNLVVVRFALNQLMQNVPDDVVKDIEGIRQTVDGIIESTRTLTADMNSGLYKLGFWSELEALAQELEQSGLVVRLTDNCPDVQLADKVSVILYRSIRELLHNTLKHAETTTASVKRRTEDGRIIVEVDDAGAGFDVAATNARTDCNGLFLTQERIWSLGGTVTISSEPRCGTRIEINVPCNGHNEHSAPARDAGKQ